MPKNTQGKDFEKNLLAMMHSQFTEVKSQTARKHDLFRKNDEYIDNPEKADKQLRSNLVKTHLQMRDATLYNETSEVIPKSTTSADKDLVRDIELAMKIDYDEMNFDKEKRRLVKHFDRYGVAILAEAGYDENRMIPKLRTIHPRATYPDHKAAEYGRDRFFYAKVKYTETDLISLGISKTKVRAIPYSEKDYEERLDAARRGINTIEVQTPGNQSYTMMHGYTYYNGDAYYVLADEAFSVVAQYEKLEAVTKEEKADKSLIKFPYVVFREEEVDGDWFGYNNVEILIDKQNAEVQLMNISYSSIKRSLDHEALLYDPNMLNDDIEDAFTRDVGGKVLVSADLKNGTGAVMGEYKKERLPNDLFPFVEWIKQAADIGSGLDSSSLGVGTTVSASATQQKREQGNTNVRLGLSKKAFVDGLEDFWWNIWRRSHIKFMKKNGKKEFEVDTITGSRVVSLTRDDFDRIKDLRFTITSKDEVDAQKEAQKAGFSIVMGNILQDPDASKYAKITAKKDWYEMNGIPADRAELYAGDTYEIRQAESDVANFLNLGVKPEIHSPDEDHLTYIEIFRSAEDMVYAKGSKTKLVPNEAKAEAIQERSEAMVEKMKKDAEAQAQAATSQAQA